MAAPIVKWAGGKGRLLPQLLPLVPARFARYVEPFFGGGALYFALAPERAVLSDVNPALIDTYSAVRDDVEAVIAALRQIETPVTEECFYRVRATYNTCRLEDPEHAAAFIYLNRTCFNGLHRVNKKGEFNVPFGRYANPRVLDAEGLRAASRALVGAALRCGDFEEVLSGVETAPDDFVYFDPPYVPVSKTSSFVAYAKEGFGVEDQFLLRNAFVDLHTKGCHVMLSNSDTPLIRELYAGFHFTEVTTSRAIAAKGSSRRSIKELVVRNYQTTKVRG